MTSGHRLYPVGRNSVHPTGLFYPAPGTEFLLVEFSKRFQNRGCEGGERERGGPCKRQDQWLRKPLKKSGLETQERDRVTPRKPRGFPGRKSKGGH